jgi:hypothetical protein
MPQDLEPLKPKPLSNSKEKAVLDIFRQRPKSELKAEIKHLEWIKRLTLRDHPNADVSDLEFFIDLRRKALIR